MPPQEADSAVAIMKEEGKGISATQEEYQATEEGKGSPATQEEYPNTYFEPSKPSNSTKSFRDEDPATVVVEEGKSSPAMQALVVLFAGLGIAAVALLGVLVNKVGDSSAPTVVVEGNSFSSGSGSGSGSGPIQIDGGSDLVPTDVGSNTMGENVCAGANPNFPNKNCIVNGMTDVGPQAGANVTKGFKGGMDVEFEPIKEPYYKKGLCPVNVHWHLGAEHYSVGEYDENGKGIRDIDVTTDGGAAATDLGSFQCHHYDENDAKFTSKYEWKHCIGMEVGQTYEVHWPHSAVGACGTPNQYQTPFYDGVFCKLDLNTFNTLSPQDIAYSVGVQAQVFTIVNDESYFWPNLMHGMIVDGEYGTDLAIYTGSTTGGSRSNSVCSAYSPITWQVDRKCHMISASSFDYMCAQMKMQRDDMTYDLVAHPSRPLVSAELTADNQANRNLRRKE